MNRSKGKTTSQKVVNIATTGMPSPVRKLSGSRIGALLIVITIPVLLATGVVSVTWENGRPRLSVNQQKAKEVKKEVTEKVQELQAQHNGNRPGMQRVLPELGGRPNSAAEFVAELRPGGEFGDGVAERVEKVKDSFAEERPQTMNFAPATDPAQRTAQKADGFLPQLKKRLGSRR